MPFLRNDKRTGGGVGRALKDNITFTTTAKGLEFPYVQKTENKRGF